MITNADLIRDALGLINVIGITRPVPAEYSAHALRQLNKLMSQWRPTLDLQYFDQDMDQLASPCPIPDYSEQAVTYYLSFALAPFYEKVPSQEMIELAKIYYNDMLRDFMVSSMREAKLVLPRAEGDGSGYDIMTGTFR